MKVILSQDVKGQGKRGQLVDVSDGYARNYLLPRKLAVAATSDNLNAMNLQDRAKKEKVDRAKTLAEDLAARIEGTTVTLHAKAGSTGKLFGSITTKEIAELLSQELGQEVDKRDIVAADHIKSYGVYELKVKLHSGVSASLQIEVAE